MQKKMTTIREDQGMDSQMVLQILIQFYIVIHIYVYVTKTETTCNWL